jgi:possible esterase
MTASTRPTPPKLPRPQRAPLATSPTLAAVHQRLLERPQLASQLQAQLWQQVTSTPLLEADPTQEGKYLVTFLWRGAAHSVLLFVNRLTDEKNLADSYMRRLPGTDTWYLTYRMDADWRASYCFLPAPTAAQAPWLQGSQVRLRQALDGGLPDPHNPVTCTNRRGFVQSVVSLPLAPAWPLGQWPVFSDDAGAGRFDGGGLGAGRGDADAGSLDAGRLDVVADLDTLGRQIWVYTPAPISRTQSYPVLLVLDGEVWLKRHHLHLALEQLMDAGLIAPAYIVFIDSGGTEQRWQELGDSESDFGGYLSGQLLNWLKAHYAISSNPADRVVIGQSLGALTVLRTLVAYPQLIGAGISQSASLWQDVLFNELNALDATQTPLAGTRAWIEVGSQEWILAPLQPKAVHQLRKAGMQVKDMVYNGGHDYACWRINLASALMQLLPGPNALTCPGAYPAGNLS